MDKIFAIGDIHGNYDLLEKILSKWNEDEEQLLFLGDYIDRGPDSLKVLHKVMELAEEKNAITLSGNHEQIFLYWLKNVETSSEFYFHEKVGGIATINSLFPTTSFHEKLNTMKVTELADEVKDVFSREIKFLNELNKYYVWEPYLFVHAGIDAKVQDFKDSKDDDFYWIREEFYAVPHKAKEIVVFGHTPTINLNEDKSHRVWVSPCQKKIGIDGGVIHEGGQLHGVVFTKNTNELTVYAAKKEEEVFSYKVTV